MTYDLYIGDYAYSSWSLRGWLLFEKFGIARTTTLVDFSDQSVAAQLREIAPARTVPAVKLPDGAVLSDSLAIAEELASRHPEAGIWPKDPAARATARNLAAEMHSGFFALRNDCPMNLRLSYQDALPSDAVLADLARLETIWAHARAAYGANGPWLCGDYSAADAFFAPVAARIAGYNLPVGEMAQSYVAAHLADPAFRRWRAMGMVNGQTLPWYAKDYATRAWPGPTPRKAIPVAATSSENATCPYSGKPVTHFMEMDGRIFGFCNALCRDKTAADPEVWPAFTAIL
ncbi:glutathione S-transferase [Shimia sp. R10_1]|uniref:glutathione S-transferase n=1 Tax=Shimia sp. R10_1 TaxID=2821095 RepID=UPI001ADB89A6|nr:glutathione S-transferase [Shimia sp. R10_1]MBO9474645.1 glutathione S-transferase [Shimia sp. R10_1]